MKSGGSSGAPPNIPQPQGANVTPYGQSPAHFNPQFRSYLPEDTMASAQLGDPVRQEYGDRTPLLEQQQSAPMGVAPSSSSGMSSSMKNFRAELMLRAERDKYLKYTNRESARGGSQAMGSFGSGGNSGGTGTKGGGLY